MDRTLAWMTLSQLPGIGVTSFWSIVALYGDPGKVLSAPRKELAQHPSIGKRQRIAFEQIPQVSENCKLQLDHLQQMGAKCLPFCHEDYPPQLKEIRDPPPVLYLHGRQKLLASLTIGMVGSRASTQYGNRVAFELSRGLAASGINIVSGMALGIDSEAHRGALEAGGWTTGVLGCGLDIVYPRQNSSLFQLVREQGVLVSEYPLGTRPEGYRFPARNRIIAGLSSGVVVVEAARKSGSLITAQLALDEGREVYAIPGRVDSYKSEGTHWLLKQGAKLVQSEGDILEDYRLSQFRQHLPSTNTVDTPSLDPATRQVLAQLGAYPVSRDNLAAAVDLTQPQLSEILLILELDGFIEVLPGNEIVRVN